MAGAALERGQSQRQASDKQPDVVIEVKEAEKQFRVKIGHTYCGWFMDTASNRKAVVVLLRQMYDSETGEWVFTEEELAVILGSPNRQAVDGHMKGYRDAGGDLLDFLKRQRKVDDAVVESVWQVFCENPYASLSEMTRQANTRYDGQKPLTKANVREALCQIPG